MTWFLEDYIVRIIDFKLQLIFYRKNAQQEQTQTSKAWKKLLMSDPLHKQLTAWDSESEYYENEFYLTRMEFQTWPI